MTTFAIVEKTSLLQTTLVNYLNSIPKWNVTFELPDKEELLYVLKFKKKPDVLLIDFDANIVGGANGVREIRKVFGNSFGIIGISRFNSIKMAKELMRSGVNGFVTKNTSCAELIAAIHTVLHKGSYLCRRLSDPDSLSDSEVKPTFAITDREEDILVQMCLEKTNKEIADELFMSLHTVNTYRTRLIQKLGVRNSIGLVKYALEKGIYRPGRGVAEV